jgi:hypothetical protein
MTNHIRMMKTRRELEADRFVIWSSSFRLKQSEVEESRGTICRLHRGIESWPRGLYPLRCSLDCARSDVLAKPRIFPRHRRSGLFPLRFFCR